MNLVEQLLKADAKAATELATSTYKSKKLAKILGQIEPVEITLKEVPSKRLNDVLSLQFDKKGNFDFSKSFDSQVMAVVESWVDAKNEELRAHFGCATAKDLVIKLFGNEVKPISDAVMELSGYGDDEDTEEEIKN